MESPIQVRRVDAQLPRVAPHVRESDLSGLLHHVAELAGKRETGLTLHDRGLDKQHFTTRAGDCKAGGHTRYRGSVGRLEEEPLAAQILSNVADVDCDRGFHITGSDLCGDLTQSLPKLALQVPDAGLAGVFGDDDLQSGVGDLHLKRL